MELLLFALSYCVCSFLSGFFGAWIRQRKINALRAEMASQAEQQLTYAEWTKAYCNHLHARLRAANNG